MKTFILAALTAMAMIADCGKATAQFIGSGGSSGGGMAQPAFTNGTNNLTYTDSFQVAPGVTDSVIFTTPGRPNSITLQFEFLQNSPHSFAYITGQIDTSQLFAPSGFDGDSSLFLWSPGMIAYDVDTLASIDIGNIYQFAPLGTVPSAMVVIDGSLTGYSRIKISISNPQNVPATTLTAIIYKLVR